MKRSGPLAESIDNDVTLSQMARSTDVQLGSQLAGARAATADEKAAFPPRWTLARRLCSGNASQESCTE